MPDNFRHAQYRSDGVQIDDPQKLKDLNDTQIQAVVDGAGSNAYWLMATFSGMSPAFNNVDQRALKILASIDGVAWSPLDMTYQPADTTSTVRDPSIIAFGTGYLLAYTRSDQLASDPTTSKVDVAFSTDLINWTQIAQPDFADTGVSPTYVWAPELFRDDNGTIYLFAGPRGSANPVAYKTSSDGVSWSASAIMAGVTNLDVQVSKLNGVYYQASASIASANDSRIELFYGPSATGPWTAIYTGASSAIQTALGLSGTSDFEGPCLVWMPETSRVRIYADSRQISGVHYIEAPYTAGATGSPVAFGAWSAGTPLAQPYRAQLRHGTVLRLTGTAAQNAAASVAGVTAKTAAGALSLASRAAVANMCRGRGLVFSGNADQRVTVSGVGGGTDLGSSDFSVHWLLDWPTTRIPASAFTGLGYISPGASGDASDGVRFWYYNGELVSSWINTANNGERSLRCQGLQAVANFGEKVLVSFERRGATARWLLNGVPLPSLQTTSGTNPPADFSKNVRSAFVGCGNYNTGRSFIGRISMFSVVNYLPSADEYRMLMSQGWPSDVKKGSPAPVAIGSLVDGQRYRISTVGTSNWASASQNMPGFLGQVFTATGAGSAGGGGQAVPLGAMLTWDFRDGSGTTAADSSGNGLNGTVAGTSLPTWVASSTP